MSANSNRPAFVAYVITERTGRKNIWTPIGAMWANKDGKGFSVKLHAIPINGELTLREPLPRRDEEDQSEPSRPDEDVPF